MRVAISIPEVIYSDENFLVINKPPGLSVHGGGSVKGKTLVDFLLREFPEVKGVGDEHEFRPGIVHRLDKDTSGIMVVARNQNSFGYLKGLFQKREIEKKYWAIVCGTLKNKKGEIDLAIGRSAANPLKRGVEKGRGKITGLREARTLYRVLKEGEKSSLVELIPKTGRMHQLRVHMASIGHPICCDVKYGGKNVCCPGGAGRQLLHAKSLSFSFPEGRRWHFEADPPEDFLKAEEEIRTSKLK